MRVRGTAIAALLTASVSVGMLTACVTEGVCVTWVAFETQQDAYDDTRLLVVGQAEPMGVTRDVLGVAMPVYATEVTDTLIAIGDELVLFLAPDGGVLPFEASAR